MKTATPLKLTIVAALACSAAAWAFPRGGQNDGGFGPPQGRPGPERSGFGPGQPPPPPLRAEKLKELGATDEQIEAVRQAQYEHATQVVDLRADLEHAELKLHYLMESDKASESDIMKAVDSLNEARGNMFKAEVKHGLKVKSILGAELEAKLRAERPSGPRDGNRSPGPNNGDRGPQGRRGPQDPGTGGDNAPTPTR